MTIWYLGVLGPCFIGHGCRGSQNAFLEYLGFEASHKAGFDAKIFQNVSKINSHEQSFVIELFVLSNLKK